MIPDGREPTNTQGGQGTSNKGTSGSGRDNTSIVLMKNDADAVSSDNITGGMTLTPSPITQVFLTQLSPGSLYVVRVKVKTVGGWSMYSMPSLPFRTPSAS